MPNYSREVSTAKWKLANEGTARMAEDGSAEGSAPLRFPEVLGGWRLAYLNGTVTGPGRGV